ncbi:hypothetical protein NQ317_016819 [Molorchus minor]|uniref:Transposase domain-containing protein n=1 Tax=Molorchus minor TaxID=1323400 RepID=A0ABQ9JIA4_9CUCU|nr:hypothetical protein NQ317_016819 [Molorchus minor]
MTRRAFSELNLRQVILQAALTTTPKATTNEIDGFIKIWLKYSPKRLQLKEMQNRKARRQRVAQEVASVNQNFHVNNNVLNAISSNGAHVESCNQNFQVNNNNVLNAISSNDAHVESCIDFSENIRLDNQDSDISECLNLTTFHQLELNYGTTTANINDTHTTNEDFALKLSQWAVSEKVSHVAVTKLLHILVPFHPHLPLDSRTLLCTPIQFKSKQVGDGQYVHMGLEKALKKFLRQNKNFTDSVIKISFNIDGLPLFKSSNLQLWPILGLVKNSVGKPFVIGIFCGASKPKPLNLYLEDFIDEFNSLRNGFVESNKTYFIECDSFVCDAPAKAFIKCVKSPGGYSCCDKCTEVGEYINGRVVLRGLVSRKRTNESFRLQLDDDHHLGNSPLLALDIDMVNNFPVDYMHNVCLGIMRCLRCAYDDIPRTSLWDKVDPKNVLIQDVSGAPMMISQERLFGIKLILKMSSSRMFQVRLWGYPKKYPS